MNRRLITESLVRVIGKQYTVSISPDLPHLIDGPDLLLAREGKLCAVFIPRVAESKNPDILLFRLALSRLGLPDHVTSALVVNNENVAKKYLNQIAWHFDRAFSNDDFEELGSFVSDFQQSRPLPANVRKLTLARSLKLFDMSMKQHLVKTDGVAPQKLIEELRHKGDFKPARVTSWSKIDKSQRRKIFQVPFLLSSDHQLVAAASFKNKRSPIPKLRTLSRLSMLVEYDLDYGVPQIINPTTNVLLVDEIPTGRFDPLKPLRAIAFAGWSVTQAKNVNDVRVFAEEVEEALRLP